VAAGRVPHDHEQNADVHPQPRADDGRIEHETISGWFNPRRMMRATPLGHTPGKSGKRRTNPAVLRIVVEALSRPVKKAGNLHEG
jgi:hypothetical protein